MYFWNYKALAEALKNNEISGGAYCGHIIFFILVVICSIPFPLLWLLVTFFVNRAGDGKDFLRRFICLLLPVAVRSLSFAMLIGIAVAIIFGMAGIADAMSGNTHGSTGKGTVNISIATIAVTLAGIWFMLIYPLIIYVRGFKIASRNALQG